MLWLSGSQPTLLRLGGRINLAVSQHPRFETVTGITPDRVTTDGYDSYPRAGRTELSEHVRRRCSRDLDKNLRAVALDQ